MSKYLEIAKRIPKASEPHASASCLAPTSAPKATEECKAVEALLRDTLEWRAFFDSCCESGHLRLRTQGWQFRDELRDRGHEHNLENIEDALWDLARDLLPESPAAKWDVEWAGELASRALRYLAEHYVEDADLSGLGKWDEEVVAAGIAEDRRAYRAAIQGYVQAGLAAFEVAKENVA